MKLKILVVVGLSLVSGCSSSDVQSFGKVLEGFSAGANGNAAQMNNINKENIAKESCLDAGLQEGTPEYASCYVEIIKTIIQTQQSQNNAYPSFKEQQFGNSLTCTSHHSGNSTITDCH